MLLSLPLLVVAFVSYRTTLEFMVLSLRHYFEDVLVFSGPMWLPTDAAFLSPSVYGDRLPNDTDHLGSSKEFYTCIRVEPPSWLQRLLRSVDEGCRSTFICIHLFYIAHASLCPPVTSVSMHIGNAHFEAPYAF